MKRNHHSSQKNSNNGVLLGILAATVVGGTIAAIAGAKKGMDFSDMSDMYHNATKRISRAANSIGEKTHDLSDRYLNRNHHSTKNRNLAVGAITGGLLGLTAMVFLTSDATKAFREQMLHSFESMSNKGSSSFGNFAHSAADRWEENVTPWLNKIENFVESLNEHESKQTRKNGTHGSQPLDKILDWASVAAQLLHSLKK